MSAAVLRLRRLAAVVVVGAGAALAAPAAPALAASCEEGAGVTVVVDFASLGRGSETACAAGDPGSGVEALRVAGFEPTRSAQQAGYFVCRIDGLPADDPCQRASPADAYWSYWTAAPGGSWAYSSTGPGDRDPRPGTVEGWAFGAGDPPSSPPPAERAAAPAPAPSTAAPAPAPTRASSAAAPAPPPAAAPAPARSSAAAAVPSTAPTPAASAPPPSEQAGPSEPAAAAPSPTGEATRAPRTAAASSTRSDGGVPAGPIAAAALVALLGAAAGRQVWLRRQPTEEGPTP